MHSGTYSDPINYLTRCDECDESIDFCACVCGETGEPMQECACDEDDE